MKFLIIDTYYPAFLKSFWAAHPQLRQESYAKQHQALIDECFGTSDYYSYNLKNLGHDAVELILNDPVSQRQWAKEQNVKVSNASVYAKLQTLPLIHRVIGRPRWVQEIALAQVKAMRPDILYLQDLSILNPVTLKKAKRYIKLIVGQTASPLPSLENVRAFDLIITSFPHYIDRLRNLGIKSEYLKIGFEPRVLKKVKIKPRRFDVTFIGSFSPHHGSGTKLLETVAQAIPIHIWGHGMHYLSPASPIHRHYHGQAWGLPMYEKLAASKIVVNRHISVAEDYANNMRLYESTGMGAMLITDEKKNIGELFKVGKEIVTYRDTDDLIKKVRYYLKHPTKRQAIAKAGQARTLSEHTYAMRMRQLSKILTKYL